MVVASSLHITFGTVNTGHRNKYATVHLMRLSARRPIPDMFGKISGHDLKLIVGSTIVFKLAGVCPAHIASRTKPHKLIGKHFIASNYAAPSILCSTPHWLIVENILPGARVIPNISCEEPHGLIGTSNVPPNFERELAFDDKASFDTSNVFSQKSKLIVDSIPSYEGAQRAASKLIVICAFGLNELIKLISASRHQ